MSVRPQGLGPDIVIAGSARSGTSYLAAQLSAHPQIDSPLVKEPNYFSRHLDRGADWYDGLFPARGSALRLDASMSFTYPQFPEAIHALANTAPHAFVIYVVREPLARALSHYQLNRHYFGNEQAETFGAALTSNQVYLGASDYERWLETIGSRFPTNQLLVVPFEVVTGAEQQVAEVVFSRLGLDPLAGEYLSGAQVHRNDVVTFRSDAVRRVRRTVKRSRAYPWVRRTMGPDRMRRLRIRLTRQVPRESLEEALRTCSPEQRAEMEALSSRAIAAASAALSDQEDRSQLGWVEPWLAARGA